MKAASRLPKPLPAVDPALAAPAHQPAGQEDRRPVAQAQRAQQAAINESPRQLRLRQSPPLAAPNRTGLPAQLKAGVESLSGHSLDDVRVHYNSAKPAQLQAHAYAQGTDIHVAPGQEQHLPHEAWHVAQQKQGRVSATTQLKGVAVNDDSGLEREADVMGQQALRQPTAEMLPAQSTVQRRPVVQRKPQVLTKFVFDEEEEDEEEDDNPPLVRDVVIGGRTPSPFGSTMGAHSTAWVAHIDAVRRQLVNRDLVEGGTALAEMARHELTSVLDSLLAHLSVEHQNKLAAAKVNLLLAIAAVAPEETEETENEEAADGISTDVVMASPAAVRWQVLGQQVRTLVNAYLTYVNYLPTATVAGGDPSGHGEGATRGKLNLFETVRAGVRSTEALNEQDQALAREIEELEAEDEDDEDIEAKEAQREQIAQEKQIYAEELRSIGSKDFAQELKTNAKLGFRAKKGDRPVAKKQQKTVQLLRNKVIKMLWNLFAPETPTAFLQSPSAKKARASAIWTPMLRNFLRTIRTAYPYAYEFTRMHTLAAQQQGLQSSLAEAGYTIEAEVLRAILGNLQDEPESEKAAPREDNTGVAASDLQQSGSGFQANVLIEADGKIGDVVMNGRTKSPFSNTMGAHTTAWTVHVDAVRRSLTGKTIEQAFRVLNAKAAQEMSPDSEVLKLSDLVDENQQGSLVQAYEALRKRALNGRFTQAELETFIGEYMTFLNYLPMSTISVGKVPDGRSEGRHRTFLNNYEVGGSATGSKAALQKHLLGMFDSKALDHFPPNLGGENEREETDFDWIMEDEDESFESHALYDLFNPKTQSSTEGLEEIARKRFFQSLLEAYPRSVLDSGLLAEDEGNDLAKEVVTEEREGIDKEEKTELQGMMHQNNCLINAIVREAYGRTVTYEELVEIRLRIGEVGTMLIASDRVISIIRDVLGINRGIIVVYQHAPSEDFGNTDDNPIFIHHTGHDHFEPGAGGVEVVRKEKRPRKSAESAISNAEESSEEEDKPARKKKKRDKKKEVKAAAKKKPASKKDKYTR